MLKLTTEDFIKKSRNIHGYKYDYSLVNYINNHIKVKIICPKHGIFEQTTYTHYNGCGCPKCAGQFMNTKYFIQKAKEKHNNKYDYSLVNYINNYIKVKIICSKHGEFLQRPNDHLSDKGCPKCNGGVKLNCEEFIEKAKIKHSDKYDYSLVDYINSITNVKIICSIHGIFKQKPANHLRGCICQKCAAIKKANNRKKSCEEFIEQSNRIHNNKYNYSLVEYKHDKIKVNIICSKHGEFLQKPNHHLNGNGCPKCNDSKGEKNIKKFLMEKDIKHECQKTFNNCINERKLFFDFYLPEQNICIEYDGEQHFKIVKYFGGEVGFNIRQKRDQIKTNYCIENNINLIRIRYDENIEDKLTPILIKK